MIMMIVYGNVMRWQVQLKWMRCNEKDGLTFSSTFAPQLARKFNADVGICLAED